MYDDEWKEAVYDDETEEEEKEEVMEDDIELGVRGRPSSSKLASSLTSLTSFVSMLFRIVHPTNGTVIWLITSLHLQSTTYDATATHRT